MPEGPPLEVAGNLYVYLIPSIFKEERAAPRSEPLRGPSSSYGILFRGRVSAIGALPYVIPRPSRENGYAHDFYRKRYPRRARDARKTRDNSIINYNRRREPFQREHARTVLAYPLLR